MKANEKLLVILNPLLLEEIKAINQYTVHSEMYEKWGLKQAELGYQKTVDG